MSFRIRLTFCLGLTACCPVLAQEDSRLAAQLATCVTCHGPDGVSPSPEFPSLAGQNEAYLLESLKELRGERSSSPVMQGITRELSDTDLQRLAAFFARKPYVRNPQTVSAEAAARGKDAYLRLCQICHHDEGRSASYAEYPLLAGQSLAYMQRAMPLMLDGKRRVEAIKRDLLSLAPREKIDDALHFFAGQQVSPDQVTTSLNTPEKKSRRNRFKN